jgi:hypothetical protein
MEKTEKDFELDGIRRLKDILEIDSDLFSELQLIERQLNNITLHHET